MRALLALFLLSCTSPPLGEGRDLVGDSGIALEPGPSHQAVLPEAAQGPLEVRYLAVGGVSLRHGEDVVLTAPMYTNPDLWEVTLGTVESRPEVVDQFLDPAWVEGAAGILVGHAHYDHLIDAPHVQELAGGPPIYGNRSMTWILGQGVPLNDPEHSVVDTRMCAEPDPCTGQPTGQEGEWVHLPDSNIRIRALCSSHPAQFLDLVHFGEGCIDGPWDEPPRRAEQWKEGATLAYLIDFLDARGEPVHRVYYQDAPTTGPTGFVHPDLLADKAVDLALLNVGSYDNVDEHPTAILQAMQPRYVLGIHWEDFFRTLDQSVQPIPFHALASGFDARVDQGLEPSDELPVLVDGEVGFDRYWRPMPGTPFAFQPEGGCPLP